MRDNKRIELYKKIHHHPLFKGTPKNEYNKLIADCSLRYYKQSEKITYFKTPDEGLFLVLEGNLEVFIDSEKGQSVLLEILQEGEIIGFSHIAHYLGDTKYPLSLIHI